MTAPAYLQCPVCDGNGMANTGRMDAEGNEVNRGGEPSWTEDDEGPCVSCGVIVRVIIDDDQEAQLVAVAPLEARVKELEGLVESTKADFRDMQILWERALDEKDRTRDVLRQFVEAMPKCEWDEYECKEVATRHAYKQQFFCAAHQFASDVQPVEWAAPLRAALALLAADQADEKAGKP